MTTYADQVIVRNAAVVLSEIQSYAEINPAFAKLLRNVKTPSGEAIERFALPVGIEP
jgi:hypothetical protein